MWRLLLCLTTAQAVARPLLICSADHEASGRCQCWVHDTADAATCFAADDGAPQRLRKAKAAARLVPSDTMKCNPASRAHD